LAIFTNDCQRPQSRFKIDFLLELLLLEIQHLFSCSRGQEGDEAAADAHTEGVVDLWSHSLKGEDMNSMVKLIYS